MTNRKPTQELSQWLEHPNELGRKPYAIKEVLCFNDKDMEYYAIKYKKSMFSSWLLGVVGYAEGEIYPSINFSEMKPFRANCVEEDARKTITLVQDFFKKKAKEYENKANLFQSESTNVFMAYILLSSKEWSFETFAQTYNKDWDKEVKIVTELEDSILFQVGDDSFMIKYVPSSISKSELIYCASNNYLWSNGKEEVTKTQAHLIITNFNQNKAPKLIGSVYTTVVSTLSTASNVIGIYTNEVIYQPDLYQRFAKGLKENKTPLFCWVWMAMDRVEGVIYGRSVGLNTFGIPEVEVMIPNLEQKEVSQILVIVCEYLINEEYKNTPNAVFITEELNKYSLEFTDSILNEGKVYKVVGVKNKEAK